MERHAIMRLVRFVFAPPAQSSTGLLSLPWREPIEEWHDDRLVELRQRGISRHIVRFVAEAGQVYALKELDERLARKEYRLLRQLRELEIPAVEVLGVVVDRPAGLDAVLVTQFLVHSVSYRALFANPRGGQPTDKLLGALVELLARLHLAGFYWGDCSLSNTLFRLDAGALAAHLVEIALWAFVLMITGEFSVFSIAYYRAALSYTTLGDGGTSPSWSMLGPLAAVDGMLMFGVSTAMIFAVIQRLLRTRYADLWSLK